MTEDTDRPNPVVSSLVLHGIVFVAFLGAFVVLALAVGPALGANRAIFFLTLFALVLTAMAAMIVGVVFYVKAKETGRLTAVRKLHPERQVIQTYWSGALMSALLKPGPLLVGTNFRGFGVTLTMSDRGLAMWRGSARHLVSLGELPWTRITAIHLETIHAVIGNKEMPALAIDIDDTSAGYQPRIQLFLCTDSGTNIRAPQLVEAKVQQIASQWQASGSSRAHE